MSFGGPNQFPVFLKVQPDGSTVTEIRKFEDFVTGSASRIGRTFTQAASQADKGFDFSNVRRAVDSLEREIGRIGKLQQQRTSDPFGIAGGLANMRNSPLQRMLNEQRAAEASLDAQRQRFHAERMQAIQQEFDASIGAIRARRAAESQAIADIIAKEDALLALERQRVAAQASQVAGRTFIQAPGFDPQAASQSAAAARQHAVALNALATAAEQVAAAESGATATDRAYASTMRASATAATEEASRLEALAVTQGKVAAASAGLNRANLELGQSQRASRFATLQASQQVQDYFIQIGAGASPMVAFSQQASQLAFVMSAAGGTAGKFARFMAGGGGTVAFALLAVIPLVGTLIGKLFEQNDAVDKAVDKMREEADQAQANARAQDIWRKSIEGVIDAVRRQKEELDRLLKSEAASQVVAVAEAQKNVEALHKELSDANKAFAALGGEPQLKRARAAYIAPEGTPVVDPELDKLEAAKKRIDAAQAAFEDAQKNLTNSQIVLGRAQGEAIADLTKRASRWSDLYSDALKGVIQRNPKLAPQASALSAAVAKVSAAASHAASAGAPFDTFTTKTKNLGIQLDHGQITVDKYTSAMGRLADELERVAKAAEDAKKNQGKVLSDFSLPVQGRITGNFGEKRPGHTHAGVDIAVPVGTQVKAAAAGTVVEVGTIPGYGNVIVVNHGNGTLTRYAHLSKFLTQKGAAVGAGDVLALSGGAKGAEGAGNSEGPHLHYEVTVGGKPVNPLKGRFPTDDFASSDRAAQIQQRLQEQAERAAQQAASAQERLGNASANYAERVQRINEQWNEQPKLIDQAAQAHRELLKTIEDARNAQADYNTLIAKLRQDKPPGFEEQVRQLEQSRDALNGVIAAAEAAGPVIDQGLLKPMNDLVKADQRAAEQTTLILAGHEDWAAALERIEELKDRTGKADTRDVATILQIVDAERARQRALQEQARLINRVVQSASVVQNAITGVVAKPFDLGSYKSGLKSIMNDFSQNFARSISETLLGGDLGTQMEAALRAKTDPLGQAGADLTQSASDLETVAAAFMEAIRVWQSSLGPSTAQVAATPTAFVGAGLGGATSFFSRLFGQIGGNTAATAGATETLSTIQQHQNDLLKRSPLLSNPEQYYNLLGANVGKSLDKAFGTGGFFGKIGGKLGTALEGAQIGQMSGSLLKAFGVKSSSTGSALGGAAGQLIAGPVGAIVGGLLGGLLGGLFKKKKVGGANITGSGTDFDITRFGNENRSQTGSHAANNILDTLEGIAQQFGVALDATKGAVSVSVRGDDLRVDPSGRGRTKGKDVVNFEQDEQAAIEYAIKNLIEDGVLGPIKDGAKKLLLESRDLQTGLTKALKFQNVFKELKQYTDPVGAAIDDLDQQFADLRNIFAQAGASAEQYAQLEQLYAFKRNDAIKAATQQLDSTLTQLLKDLQYRGDTGLSLRTRERAAKADLTPFQQQINAGQQIDQEAFSNVVNSMLDIERQMYGSTKQYFDVLTLVTQLTQKAIANATSGGTSATPAIVPVITGGGTTTPATTTYAPPTGTVHGAPITAGAAAQAANDNFAKASDVVAAIQQQTKDLVEAGLDFGEMVAAIQTAMVNIGLGTSNAGRSTKGAPGTVGGFLGVVNGEPPGDPALAKLVADTNKQMVDSLNALLEVNRQANDIAAAGFGSISVGGNVDRGRETPWPGSALVMSPWGG
jgi:murein DD-endopeptidase MepM/ murein hydrolase activator NlpD